jgi:putative holliday junction resolvase
MNTTGRILAIDYGERRTGLAMSDPTATIASGCGTLTTHDALVREITDFARSHDVVRIVVGMPRALSGSDTDMTRRVLTFIESLREATGLPVDALDERFTSSIASRALVDMGVPKMKRREKERVDEIAAILLLQDYLSMRS